MKKENLKKLSVIEWVFYPISGVLALGGVALLILGLLAKFLPMKPEDNPLAVAELDSPLTFTDWGLITLAVGLVIGVIVLLVYAQKHDREAEKSSRRAARLGKPLTSNDEIIDAEVTKPEQENVDTIKS